MSQPQAPDQSIVIEVNPVAQDVQAAPPSDEVSPEKKKDQPVETVRPLTQQSSGISSTSTSVRSKPTPSKPARHGGFSEKLAMMDDRWVWEVMSCVMAASCLVAIITVLAVHSGKPLPAWPKLISVNTMVAVFTAIMKASIMVPVAQGERKIRRQRQRHKFQR